MTDQSLEQRLVAILYADVAGYSRMVGEDEIGTHLMVRERLDRFTERVVATGGKVANYAGDAILAEFPTVSAALECAVSIQQDFREKNRDLPAERRVDFRIGVNLGEVIVERNDIFGNGVNIAARLEGLADPGGICISGAVFDAVGNKLGIPYEYMGEQSVKNIAKQVRAYRVLLDNDAAARRKPGPSVAKWLGRSLAGLVAIGVVALAGWVFLFQPGFQTGSEPVSGLTQKRPDQRSIAVLPFANLSGDQTQDYFSDGITIDIITDLSRLSNLLVIASNSVFTYKGTPVKIQQVAQELGVSHVLEGSVQKAGTKLRINAQLIEAESGHHLWADRFDGQLSDILALQDQVSARIVGALAIRLTSDEEASLHRGGATNPEAYDLLLRGLEHFRRFSRETNIEARNYFLRAIAHDPDFARAHADVALSYGIDLLFGWQQPTPELLQTAFGYAERALALEPGSPQVHFGLSTLSLSAGDVDNALEYSRRSVELSPNYADGWAQHGQALVYAGRPTEGLETIRKAMRLNPRHAFYYTWIEGHAFLLLGKHEQAIAQFERVIQSNPHFPGAHLTLAVAHAELGQVEQAAWQAAEILTLRPDFSLDVERQRLPYQRAEDRRRYIDGLRKAGLPE